MMHCGCCALAVDQEVHPLGVPRIPLPPEFENRPFLIGDAADLKRGRLRGLDLLRPHHGVRTTIPAGVLDYVPLLKPGERFSHLTAALLWPLDLPWVAAGVHVTMTSPYGSSLNRARGVNVIGHRAVRDESVVRHGVPMSSAARLFVELGMMLSEEDLVAVGDALVLDPAVLDPNDIRPWATVEELHFACERSRSPGCRQARRALERVRQGAESRTERLLRLLILGAGLKEPELGLEIDDQHGRRIGRFDMVYRDERVIVEYDGEQHRTSDSQYEKDQVRIRRAIAAGWRVVRVRKAGLFQRQEQTVEEIREALSAGSARGL